MEDRRQQRTKLSYNLKVEVREDQSLLGFVVDLNSRGMMLIADAEPETGIQMNLRLYLPKKVMEPDSVDLAGTIMWTRPSTEGDFYLGVKLLDVSTENRRILTDLAAKFEFGSPDEDFLSDPYLWHADPDTLS